jgi:hypothetical protein
MILELNARPGLAIQLANRAGLRPRLDAVDASLRGRNADPAKRLPVAARVALGQEIVSSLARSSAAADAERARQEIPGPRAGRT